MATGGAGGSVGGMGGAGGSPPVCAGDAIVCDTYVSDTTCVGQDGCFVNGICSGGGGCDAHTDEGSCEADSCTWLMPCQPEFACGNFVAASPCNLQQGCEWDAPNQTCIVKTSNGCVDVLASSDCTTLVGCSWVNANFACGGTATPCGSFDVNSCTDQDGCQVQ